MANAFLVKPLVPIGAASYNLGVSGSPLYAFNDFAGVTVTIPANGGANEAQIQFDLGADTSLDTLMVFGIELLPLSAPSAVLTYATQAEGYFSGPGGTVVNLPPYAGASLPASGKGVCLWMADAPVVARYIQIKFFAGAPSQSIRIARIVAGKRFQPTINFEYGAQFGVRDLGSLDVNARGVLLRHRGKKLRTVSLNFPSLSKQEAEGTAQKLLEQIGNTECIALCTDPAADAERQSRCYFGPLVGDLARTWASARGHEVRVNLLGVL